MDVDFLRILIDDTDYQNQKFTDEQLTSIMTLESNIYKAAATACQALAAQYALKKKTNVRGISVENQQIYEHYMDLAQNYNLRAENGDGYVVADDGTGTVKNLPFSAAYTGGTLISDVNENNADPDRIKNVFPKPISSVK